MVELLDRIVYRIEIATARLGQAVDGSASFSGRVGRRCLYRRQRINAVTLSTSHTAC